MTLSLVRSNQEAVEMKCRMPFMYLFARTAPCSCTMMYVLVQLGPVSPVIRLPEWSRWHSSPCQGVVAQFPSSKRRDLMLLQATVSILPHPMDWACSLALLHTASKRFLSFGTIPRFSVPEMPFISPNNTSRAHTRKSLLLPWAQP